MPTSLNQRIYLFDISIPIGKFNKSKIQGKLKGELSWINFVQYRKN